jgi:hypothetical protein
MTSPLTDPKPRQPDRFVIDAVAAAVATLRYGDIRLTVHDGRVVQMETTEKTRFPQA